MKKTAYKWHLITLGIVLSLFVLFTLILGQDTTVSVDGNMDSVLPQYQALKNEKLFFTWDTYASYLGGIDRNYLPSECKLYTLLYAVLPTFWAYQTGKLLTVLLSVFGSVLLFKQILKERYQDHAPVVWIGAFAYGCLGFYPMYSFGYASLPLLAFLILKILEKPHFFWFVALLFYPVLSDLRHFGIPLILTLPFLFVIRWIVKKKFPWQILVAWILLMAGYAGSEYRMLYELFAEDNKYLVLMSSVSVPERVPDVTGFAVLAGVFFLVQNILYLVKKQGKKIFHDPLNALVLWALFCSACYAVLRMPFISDFLKEHLPAVLDLKIELVASVTPFLWIVAFSILPGRLYGYVSRNRFDPSTGLPKTEGKGKRNLALLAGNLIMIFSLIAIWFSGPKYNDFRVFVEKEDPTYRAYYATKLFDGVKEDLKYDGEWAVAYGLDPAVLSYNGIRTVDGRFPYYYVNYKDYFRRVIEPALKEDPEEEAEFEDFGEKCYLSVSRGKDRDPELKMDLNALKFLGARYLFSDGEISNAEEVGFVCVGQYSDSASPYDLYVYKTRSRYTDKEHSEIPYEEREVKVYDLDAFNRAQADLRALIDEADAHGEDSGYVLKEDEVFRLYDELTEGMENMQTAYAMTEVRYYQNVNDEEACDLKDEIYEMFVDESDETQGLIRDLCNSRYREAMCRKIGHAFVDGFSEYEDMTEEEKERAIRIKSLEQEYEQAYQEEYYFDYNGETWDLNKLDERAYELEQTDQFNIYMGLEKARAEVLGEIYLELIKEYHDRAVEEDYDSYADYAYENVYVRGYTVDDIKVVLRDVAKTSGSYIYRTRRLEEKTDTDFGYITENGTEVWEKLYPCMQDIAPELGVSMKHLMDCGLYDMDLSETKMDMGFTTELPKYGDAFIYNAPFETTGDLFTFVHEFGHFNNAYYMNENIIESAENLDVAEIHSQGLEMLFTAYYRSLYGDDMGKGLVVSEVSDMVKNIPEAAMVTEFEIYAHEHPDSTVEELSKEYLKIQERYGYSYMHGIDALYNWVEIPHIFNSPCYYVAYMTSALTSLEIYTLSYEDWDTAVEKYMEITAYPSRVPYSSVIEDVGLSDIFKKGTTRDILKKTYQILKEEADG